MVGESLPGWSFDLVSRPAPWRRCYHYSSIRASATEARLESGNMLGPIFRFELLRAVRRGGHHRFRLAYALALAIEVGALLLYLFSLTNPLLSSRPVAQAEVGELLDLAFSGL